MEQLSEFATSDEMRTALWRTELGAWLHNLGKLHPEFWSNPASLSFRNPTGLIADKRRLAGSPDQNLERQTEKYSTYFPQSQLRSAAIQLGAPFDDREYSVSDLIELQSLASYGTSGEMPGEVWLASTSRLSWLLAIAHDRASDLEKEASEAKKQATRPAILRSTVFGIEDGRTPDAIEEAWNKFGSDPASRWDLFQLQQRDKFLAIARPVLSLFPADTQRPINDVTIYDISFAVAALLKAAVARFLLERTAPPPPTIGSNKRNDEAHRWRHVRFAVDAPAFMAASNRIPDLLARRNLLGKLYDTVTEFFETGLWLANEIYRDDVGPVYLWPVLSGDEDGGKLREFVESRLREVIGSSEIVNEIGWELQLGASDPRGLGLGDLLARPLPPAVPTLASLESWWTGIATEPCVACAIRPQSRRMTARKLCEICLDRQERRCGDWVKHQDHTIWLEEAADVRGRVALVTAELKVQDWLRGKETEIARSLYLKKLDSGGTPLGPEKRKSESFARIERVVRTAQEFWEAGTELVENETAISWKRLTLSTSANADLKRNHSYVLKGQRVSVSAVWTGKEFLTADNLERLVPQPGAQEWVKRACLEFEGKSFQVVEQTGYGQRDTDRGTVTISVAEAAAASFSATIEIAREPGRWQFFIPAKDANRCMGLLWKSYEGAFARVRHRLPMRVSVLFADRYVPLRSMMDASRRTSGAAWCPENVREVESVESKDGHTTLHFADSTTWNYPAFAGTTEPDIWYSYLRRRRNEEETETLPHLLRSGDRVYALPSTYDAEFLQSASDRFDLHYTPSGQRSGVRKSFPFLLEKLAGVESAWHVLWERTSTSQLEQLYSLLRQKEEEWGFQADTDGHENAQWHEFCQRAVASLNWRREPSEKNWELLRRLIADDLLLDVLEIHLKISKDFPGREAIEQEEVTQ